MRRREFIAGVAGVAAWPVVARAQQKTALAPSTTAMPRVAVLVLNLFQNWFQYLNRQWERPGGLMKSRYTSTITGRYRPRKDQGSRDRTNSHQPIRNRYHRIAGHCSCPERDLYDPNSFRGSLRPGWPSYRDKPCASRSQHYGLQSFRYRDRGQMGAVTPGDSTRHDPIRFDVQARAGIVRRTFPALDGRRRALTRY